MPSLQNTTSPDYVEINLSRINNGLGFHIRGGTDKPHYSHDTGIFVSVVDPHGAAGIDGRLQPGDKIIEINGHSLLNLTHQEAVSKFKDTRDQVKLKILPKNYQSVQSEPERKNTASSIINDVSDYDKHFGRNLIIPTVLGALFVGLIGAFVIKRYQTRV